MNTIVIPAINASALVAFVGILFTLAFQYVPGLRLWFATKTGESKKGFFLITSLTTGVVWFVLGSLQLPAVWGVYFEPMSVASLLSALVGVVLGTGGSQGLFELLPQLPDVIAAKATRNGGAG